MFFLIIEANFKYISKIKKKGNRYNPWQYYAQLTAEVILIQKRLHFISFYLINIADIFMFNFNYFLFSNSFD